MLDCDLSHSSLKELKFSKLTHSYCMTLLAFICTSVTYQFQSFSAKCLLLMNYHCGNTVKRGSNKPVQHTIYSCTVPQDGRTAHYSCTVMHDGLQHTTLAQWCKTDVQHTTLAQRCMTDYSTLLQHSDA